MNVEAFNAISNPADLGDHIIALAGLAQCARIQRSSANERARLPPIVLGGTGYVAGELLRLIAGHPQLEVAAILSDSQPGAPVADAFAHLRSAYPDLKFAAPEELQAVIRRDAACRRCFPRRRTALPPPSSIGCLATAAAAGTRVHCVDISADFRYASAGRLRSRVQACARRAGENPRIHLRRARASAEIADAACRASRLLRDRHAARQRAVAGAWA